jgi:ABC-2 type transport system ATP-binding protein
MEGTSTKPEAVIETRGLRRVFRSRSRQVEAVVGVDLDVRPGEIFGFLGPNGAGKTTTLRMLATLLSPSGGTARVAGCDLATQPGAIRERIGYVGQAGGADREITGRTELVFQGRLYGMSAAAAQERAGELIGMLELEGAADRKVETYSGGQKRRLDIGLGLVHDPQLLFLDEPTTGLDPQSRARVWEEVRKMHDRGTTVFELVKDQDFVREARLENGTVQLYVDRGELAMPAILRLLEGANLQLTAVELHRPSLDDVFLRQTGRSLRETAA